ncbi:hypothetical protein BHE74_00050233 [Ensete ventricosum]|nr:hypothetical protein BHE74_00050233 [Ensete ventricosum]
MVYVSSHVEASSDILRYSSQRIGAAEPNAYISATDSATRHFHFHFQTHNVYYSRDEEDRRRERQSEGKSKKIPNANSIPQHRLLLLSISDRNPKALPVLPPSSSSSPSRSFPRRPDPLLRSRSRPADPFGHRSVVSVLIQGEKNVDECLDLRSSVFVAEDLEYRPVAVGPLTDQLPNRYIPGGTGPYRSVG